jgi:hypothetical protein
VRECARQRLKFTACVAEVSERIDEGCKLQIWMAEAHLTFELSARQLVELQTLRQEGFAEINHLIN